MNPRVLAMAFLLSLSSNVNAYNCSDSPYWSNRYVEKISDDLCLTVSNAAGAAKTIMVDTNETSYLGLDLVWFEIYDWNGDKTADWIRLSNYFNGSWQDDFYFFGESESISFYHGPEELYHMIKTYGDHLSGLVGMAIPETEMGTTSYDGSFNGLKFKPISHPDIQELFAVADSLLAHSTEESGAFAPLYNQAITKIMSRFVVDYPVDWRTFDPVR